MREAMVQRKCRHFLDVDPPHLVGLVVVLGLERFDQPGQDRGVSPTTVIVDEHLEWTHGARGQLDLFPALTQGGLDCGFGRVTCAARNAPGTTVMYPRRSQLEENVALADREEAGRAVDAPMAMPEGAICPSVAFHRTDYSFGAVQDTGPPSLRSSGVEQDGAGRRRAGRARSCACTGRYLPATIACMAAICALWLEMMDLANCNACGLTPFDVSVRAIVSAPW